MAKQFLIGTITINDGDTIGALTLPVGVTASFISSGSNIFINGLNPVQAISGTDTTLTFNEPWAGGNLVNAPLVATFSSEGLVEAVQKALLTQQQLNAILLNHEELLTSTNTTVTIDINGTATDFTPYQYLSDQVSSLVATASGAAQALSDLTDDVALLQLTVSGIQGDLNDDLNTSNDYMLRAGEYAVGAVDTLGSLTGVNSSLHYETYAMQYAVNPVDVLGVNTGVFSTLHYHTKIVALNALSLVYRNDALSYRDSALTYSNNASVSATNAEISNQASEGFSDDAESDALLASQYANHPEDVFIPNTTDYSAFHWKQKAAIIVGGSDADSLGGIVAANYFHTNNHADRTGVLEFIGTAKDPDDWVTGSFAPFHTDTIASDYVAGFTVSGGNTNTHTGWQMFSHSDSTVGDDDFYLRSGKAGLWEAEQKVLTDVGILRDGIKPSNIEIEPASGVTSIVGASLNVAPVGGLVKLTGAGAIEIELPDYNFGMFNITATVYNYGAATTYVYSLSGYNYGSNNSILNSYAHVTGQKDNESNTEVRFGQNAGGKPCIWLGNLTSSWSNAVVAVKDIVAGYSGGDSNKWNSVSIGLQVTAFTVIDKAFAVGYRTGNVERITFDQSMSLQDYNSNTISLVSPSTTGALRFNTSTGYQGGFTAELDGVALSDNANRPVFKISNGGANADVLIANNNILSAHATGLDTRGELTLNSPDGTVGHKFDNDITDSSKLKLHSNHATINELGFFNNAAARSGSVVGDGNYFGLKDAAENWAVRVVANGETLLWHSGVAKLSTKADGVDVTGNLTINGGTDIQTQLDDVQLQINQSIALGILS